MWNIKHPDNICIYSFGSQCKLQYNVFIACISMCISWDSISWPQHWSRYQNANQLDQLLDDTCNLLHICFPECYISWSRRKPLTHHHSQLTNVRRLTAHFLPSLNERFVCFYSSEIKYQLDVRVKLFLSLITRMLIKKKLKL